MDRNWDYAAIAAMIAGLGAVPWVGWDKGMVVMVGSGLFMAIQGYMENRIHRIFGFILMALFAFHVAKASGVGFPSFQSFAKPANAATCYSEYSERKLRPDSAVVIMDLIPHCRSYWQRD